MKKKYLFALFFIVILFSLNYVSAAPGIIFVDPTPANGIITSNTSAIMNISITDASDLKEFKWNWNGTNYTFYNNSLVLMMNFNNISVIGENPTKVVDVSLNSVNGTVYNSVFNATGKYGGAYQFNGFNAWINGTKRATSAVDNWAIAAWIKPAKLPQGGSEATFVVYNGNDGNSIVGGYGFGIGNGAGLAGSNLQGLFGTVSWINGGYTFPAADTWYYVVMTRVSETTYFYVNGVQTGTSAAAPNPPVNVLSIGCQLNFSNSTWRYFNGTIDEIRIYNRSLSANEVKQHYYSNLNKYDTDKWTFITNESNLTTQGSYTYQGCANNTVGNQNCTETRIIYMGDWVPPIINFTNPTPANGTITSSTSLIANISIINASDMNEFKWNWNGTNYTFYNNSLVLMLNLDNVSAIGESATTAVDVSPGINNAILTNSPTLTTSGKYGSALNFAGTTYATTTITGFSASTGTVLMWIKPNKDLRSVTQALFDTKPSAVGALRIYSNSDNTLRYETGGTLTPLAWTIPSDWTGQWHQIGLNWSGSVTALIVDGAVIASGSNSQAPAITTFEIGRYNSGSNFNGTIDEIRVYSKSLSAGELKQQYYSNLNKYATDKWAFYTNQSNLTDGIYTYYVYAADNSSNSNKTETRTITIDTINDPPVMNLSSITSNQYPIYSNSTLLGWCNATDADNNNLFYNYQWYNNSVLYSSGATASSYTPGILVNVANITSILSVGDNWTLSCQANDSINVSSWLNSSQTTIPDTTPPNIANATSTPSLPLSNNGSSQNLSVNFTSSEYPINMTFNLYNSTGSIVNTNTTTLSSAGELPVNYSIPALSPDGVYSLNMTATDSSGNSNTTALGTITVDTIAPVVSNVQNTSTTNQSTLIVWSTDENSNSSVSYGATTALLSGSNSSATLTTNHSIYLGELMNNTLYYYNVTSCDALGNCNASGTYNFTTAQTTDIIAPSILIISPLNTTYNYTNILVNISSDGNSVWYNWNNTNVTYTAPLYVNFNNGSNIIYAYANDSAGNLNQTNATFFAHSDVDNDRLPDYADRLLYNETSVATTGLSSLDITANANTSVDSNVWNGTFEIDFYDAGNIFMNFTHNFTTNKIDLSKVSIEKTSLSLVVNLSGQLASGENKTMYIDDNSFISLCIKDGDIASSDQISSGCDGANETDFTSCLGKSTGITINNITCYDEGLIIRIENLIYSGISGTQASLPSGGGSGGGGSGCLYNWNCVEWGKCSQEGKQTRTCNNIGTCPDEYNVPKTEQICTYPPSEKALPLSEKTLLPSEKALFDIILTIINPRIILGENLTSKISLVNFGNKTNLNVTLNYTITDSKNKIILRETEIVSVEIQNEFIKEFVLPPQITQGAYKLFVEINYEGQEKEAASQGSFEILAGKVIWIDSSKINYWIICVSFIIVVYILIKKIRRENKQIIKYKWVKP